MTSLGCVARFARAGVDKPKRRFLHQVPLCHPEGLVRPSSEAWLHHNHHLWSCSANSLGHVKQFGIQIEAWSLVVPRWPRAVRLTAPEMAHSHCAAGRAERTCPPNSLPRYRRPDVHGVLTRTPRCCLAAACPWHQRFRLRRLKAAKLVVAVEPGAPAS